MKKPWTGPRSVCTCGHSGDVSAEEAFKNLVQTEHGGLIGHGPCKVPGCDCRKFTWAKFLPAFERTLETVAQ